MLRIFANFRRKEQNVMNLYKVRTIYYVPRDKYKKLSEEEEENAKRDVSRMPYYLKNSMEKHLQPPELDFCYTRKTKNFRMKTFGKYGKVSGINPGISWPTKDELKQLVEIEKDYYPPLDVLVRNAKEKKEAEEAKIEERKKEILSNMEQHDTWVKEVEDKRRKKEAEAEALRAKKQRLIDEVTQHFGYRIDPKNEKFQKMLEQKELDEIKLEKEAKKKAKIAAALEKMEKEAKKAELERKKRAELEAASAEKDVAEESKQKENAERDDKSVK